MHDVFRAATLSFLSASLYLLFSAGIDYVVIFALGNGNPQYTPQASFRMALATASLLASLLCVWVLLVTAFARSFINRLRPGSTLIAAISVAAPLVLSGRLLALADPQATWSPTASLLFSLIWSSGGLLAVLWYLTTDAKTPSNDV